MSTPATKARKPSAPEGRRELKDIIATATAMQERRLNPFHMDVGDALETADKYFGMWEEIPDLILDAKALNSLSRVVKMQEGRLRYEAQLFRTDPEAMAEKLHQFGTDQLAKALLAAWHPVVELEQLTPKALEEALEYWEHLEPVALRHRERPRRAPPAMETVSLDDLMAKGIVPRDSFGDKLTALHEELKASGPTEYWQFIGTTGDHKARVDRAYAAAYLITYGFAALVQRDGQLVLQPRGERDPPTESVSMPIVVPG